MKHDHVAALVGHLGAPGAGDLVAHAGEAELAVEGAGLSSPASSCRARPGKPPAAVSARSRRLGDAVRRRRPPARSSARWCWSAWSPLSTMSFQCAYSLRARGASSLRPRFQSPSAAPSSTIASRASPTTESARCLVASKRPALIEMKRASGENTDHEPVVKSCSRVPIATTTSASPASTLAEAEPITPIGPTLCGCSCDERARARRSSRRPAGRASRRSRRAPPRRSE